MPNKRSGFTLIELLISIAIVAMLAMIAFMAWRNQINKANDAKRKEDLERLSIAFEEYFNDHECYPPSGIIDICGGSELEPYLYSIPCDPVSKTPYCYIHDPENPDCGKSFKLFAPLSNLQDSIIEKLLCHGEENCGYDAVCEADTGNDAGFNYGVGSGNVSILNPAVDPPPSSPLPSTSPNGGVAPEYEGTHACDPSGVCNVYEDPESAGCPITFYNSDVCQEYCDNSPDYWCEQ